MWKITDALRGIPLDIGQKQKIVALDHEFADMEAEITRLKAENLNLQAQVNPLQRQVEQMRQQQTQSARMDEMSEKFLLIIANNPEATHEQITRHLQLSIAKADYHADILKGKKFIRQATVATRLGNHSYAATSEGRAYLMDNDLL